jgi:hypothetical protein
MSSTVLSNDMRLALLRAMGCPTGLCTRVSFEIEMGELAAVNIRYNLDPAWIEAAGKELREAGEL